MPPQLRRDLGLSQATFTVVGIVIGSGIFVLPALVFAKAQAPGLGILAWVIGGLISLAAGLTVAELSAAMPKAGGSYIYLREAYGDWMAFLQGWATFLAYSSAMQAAIALIFTTYLTALIPLSHTTQIIIGIALLAVLNGINTVGVRFGGWLQVVAGVGKLVPIALLILFGFFHLHTANLTPVLPHGISLWSAVAAAVLPTLWAYDGWINVSQVAEEVKNPQRNLPLAIIGGLLLVLVVYALFNVAMVGVIPAATLATMDKPVVPMAQQLFGHMGSNLITVGMLVSMLGTMNGMIMTVSRYFYAMAADNMFPAAKWVSRLHPRYQTPAWAIWLGFAWSVVLLLSGQFGQLLNLVVFVGWLFYTFTMAAVMVLRRTRPEMNRPYKVWGYPVVPLIGIGSGLWILVNSYISDPRTSLLGTGLTLTGVPLYWWLRRKKRAAES